MIFIKIQRKEVGIKPLHYLKHCNSIVFQNLLIMVH